MIDQQSSDLGAYQRLRTAALESVQAGRLEQALELLDGALELARASGDAELEGRAFCNRAAVAITLGDLEGPVPELRRILMANGGVEAPFLAAYNIARVYELRKEHKKGLFYARIARDRASALDHREWLGSALNQIGNFLVAESHFSEAADTYRRALSLLSPAATEARLSVHVNLGYCALMKGQSKRGLGLLYRALREARQGGWQRLEMIAHLDLCYGLMEVQRLSFAWKHGSRGLAIAETIGQPDQIKNALFLLGEVAVKAGDTDSGRRCFSDLQERFYPDQPYLPDLLVSVDVRPMVNLRA